MSSLERKSHWDRIYKIKGPSEVSWYKDHLETSLQIVKKLGVDSSAHIIDVGGGTSSFALDLVKEGFKNITVLDISPVALSIARSIFGLDADKIVWIEGDITSVDLPKDWYDIWHDRALFHFLLDLKERRSYVRIMENCLKKGAHAIIATFAIDGPPKCSGLDVIRYTPYTLQNELGEGFKLVESVGEKHITPWGTEQRFIYCCFKKL